jgi:hypothetical protein
MLIYFTSKLDIVGFDSKLVVPRVNTSRVSDDEIYYLLDLSYMIMITAYRPAWIRRVNETPPLNTIVFLLHLP